VRTIVFAQDTQGLVSSILLKGMACRRTFQYTAKCAGSTEAMATLTTAVNGGAARWRIVTGGAGNAQI